MKGLEKKNTFAKTVLIIALVYAAMDLIMSSVSLYKIYSPIDLARFIEKYYENTAAGIFIVFSSFLLTYVPIILTVIWVIFIAIGKGTIKTPVIITFVYVSFKLLHGLFFSLWDNCGLIELVRENYLTALIFTAWLFILIGTGQVHRIVFAILRGIAAAVTLFGYIRWEFNNLKMMFSGNMNLMNQLAFIIYLMTIFIIVVFILWIFKPELFEKKNGK